MDEAPFKHDVFISHASEDKRDVAEPLAQLLTARGLTVWLDKYELKMGDELLTEIDHGLSESRYGVVILSQNFFKKRWPRQELNGLVSLEADRQKVILPVWHRVHEKQVREYSPILASRIGASTDYGLEYVAFEICRVVQGGPVQGVDETRLVDPDDRDLKEIRSDLLMGPSADALTTLDFRVDEVLERRPGHVEARVLKQQVQKAMRAEQRRMDHDRPMAMPNYNVSWLRARSLLVAFSIFVCGGFLAYYYRDQVDSPTASPPLVKQPEEFAGQWLSLLDKGEFETAWAALDDSLKEHYPLAKFIEALQPRRNTIDPGTRFAISVSQETDGKTTVRFTGGRLGDEVVVLQRRKETWVVTNYSRQYPRDRPFTPDHGASR